MPSGFPFSRIATRVPSSLSGVLYSTAGVLSAISTTGSGNAVLATSPTLITPTIASLIGNKIYPASDGPSAIQFTKADGSTYVARFDTTGGRLTLGSVANQGGVFQAYNATNAQFYSIGGSPGMQMWIDSTQTKASRFFTDTNGDLKLGVYNGTSWNNSFLLQNSTGNIGIGTSAPNAKLDVLSTTEQLRLSYSSTYYTSFTVDATGLLTLGGTVGALSMAGGLLSAGITTGYTLPSGAGTRLMWIPAQGAFRAGIVTTDAWDSANIGYLSVAFGKNNKASGSRSFAMGELNTASGPLAVAFGYYNTASHDTSFVIGANSVSSGISATAIGRNVTASGEGCIAMGYYVTASTSGSIAMGRGYGNTYRIVASGQGSIAMGRSENTTVNGIIASGSGSICMGLATDGNQLRADGTASIAMGQDCNALTNNNVLVFGRGLTVSLADSFNVGFGTGITTPDFQVVSGAATVNGIFNATSYKVGGTAGASGSFTTTDSKTVTVVNGIITSIAA